MGDEVDLTACLNALTMGVLSPWEGETPEIWWFSPTTGAAADAEQKKERYSRFGMAYTRRSKQILQMSEKGQQQRS